MNVEELRNSNRADTETITSDHDRWALHKFAFDYDKKPPRFRKYHPEEGREPGQGYYDDYIPVAHDAERGRVLRKTVTRTTVQCHECEDEVARMDEKGSPICPGCGMVCDDTLPTFKVVKDGITTERADGHI